MSRPEARRRQQQSRAHQIADGVADFFDVADVTDAAFRPASATKQAEAAFVAGARRAFAFPAIAVSLVVAVVGGIVWGVFSGRR